MKESGKKLFILGGIFIVAFVIWTVLVCKVDVQPLGAEGTNIGFASMNFKFHKLTGVHMGLYHITDWLGLVPIFVCMIFGFIGLVQLIKRKSLFKVDCDIILIGIYYMVVIFSYFIFEIIPINYRPVLIEGALEVSYPSSTTLLVLCVMPTFMEQVKRRSKNIIVNKIVMIFGICFSGYMVIGRLISGVHWISDIIGSVIFSTGLFCIYKAVVLVRMSRNTHEMN